MNAGVSGLMLLPVSIGGAIGVIVVCLPISSFPSTDHLCSTLFFIIPGTTDISKSMLPPGSHQKHVSKLHYLEPPYSLSLSFGLDGHRTRRYRTGRLSWLED